MTVLSATSLEPLTVPGSCRSLVQRWRSVVRSVPDRPALTSAGSSFTFADADVRSDIVAARLLRDLPAGQEPVGVFLDHTAEALIGVLAVMKAGRIFVILDPHLPGDRLRQIVELAGCSSCVVDAGNATTVKSVGALSTIFRLEELMDDGPLAETDRALLSAAEDHISGPDTVSIIFTSGSTGRPKGVVQTHEELLNEVYGNGLAFAITPQDRVAMVLPYGFAAGLYLTVSALLNGAGLWSYDPRDSGTRGLITWIQEHRLSALYCTPHLLRSLAGAIAPGVVLDSLRLVTTLGEAIHGRDVEAIRPFLARDASFFNWTGSSEMGSLATFEIPGGSPIPFGVIPAGRPIANKTVRLVGPDGVVVPAGESGEILAVSYYLSGGYWQDEAGNATRFTVDPDGQRVCHQADLGRIDENGDLILLGRADAAIKVRGYFVEPSEIEAAILASDAVKEVVVIPIVDPPKPTRLIAYVVGHSNVRTESPAALRRRLRTKLPEYMIPSAIVQLAALPRNERGKVDRPSLPQVEPPTRSAPPTSQRDIVVADLWAEVLGLDYVGLDDDFMALGGDSLSAEEMLAMITERLGITLVSSDLIEAPTLAEFTRRLALGKASLPSHPDVVTLQSGGSGTPVFCFAGAGALALTFLPLSRHLDDHPVYAFQAHGLERRALPDWTVQANARRYLEIIRIIAPHGPYLLVGHSFGGLVALDIARLLTDAGETVELVALLDTYLPSSSGKVPAFEYVPMAERPLRPTVMRRAGRALSKPIRYVLPDGLPAVRQWNRQARAYLAGVVVFSGQQQFDAFFDHGAITGRRYAVAPYPGRAMVVLADNNPDGPDAWLPLLSGPHRLTHVASEHSSLLREPHATELAALLVEELELARTEQAG